MVLRDNITITSYKGKALLRWLTVQRFCLLSSRWHAGRHSTTEVAERSTSCSGNRKWTVSLRMTCAYMRLLSLPPQWCALSKKTTPTPTRPHLLKVPSPLGTNFFQATTLGSLEAAQHSYKCELPNMGFGNQAQIPLTATGTIKHSLLVARAMDIFNGNFIRNSFLLFILY